MRDERIAAVLERSAALLEEQGWIQGEYTGYNGNGGIAHCSVGAIRAVCGNGGGIYWDQAEEWLCRALGHDPAAVTSPQHFIVRWNDEIGRTKQEVLDAFHKAAKLALGVAE